MLLKKIVVAEDDDGIAHMLAAALGDAGYLCLRARDGEEALALVRAQLPDALLLDVMMPKLSGIDVVRKLKADVMSSRVPVLMLTSLGDVDDKVSGLDAGADDYLTKPFDFRELRARVKALIRQSRRERDRDPTTGLPGATAVEEHVGALISSGKSFSIAYLELTGYQRSWEHAGFVATQALVRRLGELVLDRARGLGFAAHLGSGDFVVVASDRDAPVLASEIAEAYQRKAGSEAGGAAGGTSVRTLIVSGEGCRSVEDLAARIVKSRGAWIG
ncbi:MAG TPA: response regulator [Polyangia bacterium]|nr:response regulator [Polyangia bacterium]